MNSSIVSTFTQNPQAWMELAAHGSKDAVKRTLLDPYSAKIVDKMKTISDPAKFKQHESRLLGHLQLAHAIEETSLYLTIRAIMGKAIFRCTPFPQEPDKIKLLMVQDFIQEPKDLPLKIQVTFPKEMHIQITRAGSKESPLYNTLFFIKGAPHTSYRQRKLGSVVRLENQSGSEWVRAYPNLTLPFGFGWVKKFLPENGVWGTPEALREKFSKQTKSIPKSPNAGVQQKLQNTGYTILPSAATAA